jgi:hypothetical protein
MGLILIHRIDRLTINASWGGIKDSARSQLIPIQCKAALNTPNALKSDSLSNRAPRLDAVEVLGLSS